MKCVINPDLNGMIKQVRILGDWAGDPEPIGFDRRGHTYYETMVFRASTRDDGDECGCAYRVTDYRELESCKYVTGEEAYRGHMELCEKWDRVERAVVHRSVGTGDGEF